jgi:hypothetical protein
MIALVGLALSAIASTPHALWSHSAPEAARGLQGTTAFQPSRLRLDYGRSLPLNFERNDGQSDPGVHYLSRTPRSTVFT